MLRVIFSIAIAVAAFTSSLAHDGLKGANLGAEAKREIAQAFVALMPRAKLMFVRTRAENVVPSAWERIPCSKKAFVCMRANQMFPSHQSVDCLAMTHMELSWYSTVYPSRDPEENGRLLRDMGKGLYRPLLRMPSRPILSFVKRLEVGDSMPYIEPVALRLGLEGNELGVLSNLCKNATFQLSPVMSFEIEGAMEPEFSCALSESEKKIVEMERKLMLANCRQNGAIVLSKREATEMVYVTALCRGEVGSMKEFNKKYVGKALEFIVELTDSKCETDFGRMLYSAASASGLFPKVDSSGRKTRKGQYGIINGKSSKK